MIQNIECTKSFIDYTQSKQYVLSIRLQADGFCFSILNLQNNKFIFFKNIEFEPQHSYIAQLESWLKTEDLFQLEFNKINIVFSTSDYTLVPKETEGQIDVTEIYNFNFTKKKDEQILSQPISPKMLNIFACSQQQLELLKNNFPQACFFHQSQVMIQDALRKTATIENTNMFVDICEGFVTIVVASKSELMFSNSFLFTDEMEWCFYIVNVFSNLNLSQTETTLLFSGYIEKESASVSLLNQYIQNIIFDNCSDFLFISDFDSVEKHKISKKLKACVL